MASGDEEEEEEETGLSKLERKKTSERRRQSIDLVFEDDEDDDDVDDENDDDSEDFKEDKPPYDSDSDSGSEVEAIKMLDERDNEVLRAIERKKMRGERDENDQDEDIELDREKHFLKQHDQDLLARLEAIDDQLDKEGTYNTSKRNISSTSAEAVDSNELSLKLEEERAARKLARRVKEYKRRIQRKTTFRRYLWRVAKEVRERADKERFDRLKMFMDQLDASEDVQVSFREILPNESSVGMPVLRRLAGMKSGVEAVISEIVPDKGVKVKYADGEEELVKDYGLLEPLPQPKVDQEASIDREIDFFQQVLHALDDQLFHVTTRGYEIVSRFESPDINVPDLMSFWYASIQPDKPLQKLETAELRQYRELFTALSAKEIARVKKLRASLLEENFRNVIEGMPSRFIRTLLDILYTGRLFAKGRSFNSGFTLHRAILSEYKRDLNNLKYIAGKTKQLRIGMSDHFYMALPHSTRSYYETLCRRFNDYKNEIVLDKKWTHKTRFEAFRRKKMDEIVAAISALNSAKKMSERRERVETRHRLLEEQYATMLHGIASVPPIESTPYYFENFNLRFKRAESQDEQYWNAMRSLNVNSDSSDEDDREYLSLGKLKKKHSKDKNKDKATAEQHVIEPWQGGKEKCIECRARGRRNRVMACKECVTCTNALRKVDKDSVSSEYIVCSQCAILHGEDPDSYEMVYLDAETRNTPMYEKMRRERMVLLLRRGLERSQLENNPVDSTSDVEKWGFESEEEYIKRPVADDDRDSEERSEEDEMDDLEKKKSKKKKKKQVIEEDDVDDLEKKKTRKKKKDSSRPEKAVRRDSSRVVENLEGKVPPPPPMQPTERVNNDLESFVHMPRSSGKKITSKRHVTQKKKRGRESGSEDENSQSDKRRRSRSRSAFRF